MHDHRRQYTIVKMSQLFGVSRSGYYSWLHRGPSRRQVENKRLSGRIKTLWEQSSRTYGSPRIHRQLVAQGETISRPRVARLMRQMGIQSRIRAAWTPTTDSAHQWAVAANVLDRRFTGWDLAQAWVSDITYLPSADGWLYLTTVMDLADRQIIGWALSTGLSAEQTSLPAFKKACQRRPITAELLFHSDRGVQYACRAFTRLLATHKQVTQSMSRKGNCWDNAPAESFFKTLKAELPAATNSLSYWQVRGMIFEYIERWYNPKRLHSALDYRSPRAMQQFLIQQQTLAA